MNYTQNNTQCLHQDNREKEVYLNFDIYKCYSIHGTPYFTIVNPNTNVHVHSSTIKIARSICDEADFFLKYGNFKTNRIDIMNRASKLALRTSSIPRKKPLMNE